jgi:uncharacterized protein YecE (DUF72 family)
VRVVRLITEALAQGREVFVIVNNKAEGSSPRSLIELARSLASEPQALKQRQSAKD